MCTFEEFLQIGIDSKVIEERWSHEELSVEIIYKKFKKIFSSNHANSFDIKCEEVMSLLVDYDVENKVIQTGSKKTLLKIGLDDEEILAMQNFLKDGWHLNYLIKGEPYNVDRLNYLILDSNRAGVREYG